jgi:hypothetical protein
LIILVIHNKLKIKILDMKKYKYIIGLFLTIALLYVSCGEDTYEFGDLNAPTNIVINTEIVGASNDSPEGDGSGEVLISVTADNAFTYHIGYSKIDDFGNVSLAVLPGGMVSKKFTDPGINTYRITVVAFGKGGVSSNLTKDITIRSDYVPNPEVVTAITNDSSKTWVVNKDIPAHFGVDDWTKTEYTSSWWWSAGIEEKADCCNCFYTATFTFVKNANDTYTLTVDAPDGAFTKTGALANVAGIPATGDEGCYSEYTGGSSPFNFVPSASPISEATSTKVAIKLADNNTFIGYGAVQSEYEVLQATSDKLYLRVQGTETGNAWYIVLKPAE